VLLVIEEVPDVEVSIGVDLHSLPALLVVVELALVELTVALQVYPPPLPALPVHLPEVDLVVALDQLELGTVEEGVDAERLVREGEVGGEVLAELVLGELPDA
jgi:hypothetical protein